VSVRGEALVVVVLVMTILDGSYCNFLGVLGGKIQCVC
jgi:hypothetical protein